MKKKIAVHLLLIFSFLFFSTSPAAASQAEKKTPEIDAFTLFNQLMERLGDKDDKTTTSASALKKFTAIYTKFYHRPELLTAEVLSLMYDRYEKYNVMVDFIEKLPIRQPETAIKLFIWVENFDWFTRKDGALFNTVFQSLLELLSHAAKYAPDRYDYDMIVEKLISIPFNRPAFYDNVFAFLKTALNIEHNKKELIDIIDEGINDRDMTIDGVKYQFNIKASYKKNIDRVLESQNVCSFSTLLTLNYLFHRLVTEKDDLTAASRTFKRIEDLCLQLPYAEISEEAPKAIRERVMAYSRDKLGKDVGKLFTVLNNAADVSRLNTVIGNIKTDYLLHHLSQHLLATAYAVNAKNPKLKVFLNPNMVRLHDFESQKERTAWNFCGTPPVTEFLGGYHLSGGLSRLNIVFAFKWYEHLFGRTYIYNPRHLQAVLVNLLEYYPLPRTNWDPGYNALMVDFGLELLRKARESDNNDPLRHEIVTRLNTITAGYNYRKAVDYLTGKTREHHLFFKEIKLLGEAFFKEKKHLESSAYRDRLKAWVSKPFSPPGNIYYHTFGNLTPRRFNLFPQDAAVFFDSGRLSGEMVDEFKIKLDWHLHKKKIPPVLLGQVLYSYLTRTVPRILSQNHVNDYFSTYFVFKVFNNSHLKGILKKLQKEGYLKLK